MMSFIADHSGLIVSVLFFVMFSAIAVWSYLPRNEKRLQSYGTIPLGDENE